MQWSCVVSFYCTLSKNPKKTTKKTVGHELRTPLTSISLAADELKELSRTTDDKKILRIVNIISNASQVLLAMINDILDMSQILAGKMKIRPCLVDMKELMQQVLDIVSPFLNENPNVKLNIKVGVSDTELVSLDQSRLRQVLLNLVRNALKFTREGNVTLSACWEREGETMRFSCEDTGCGIDETEIPKLFQSFNQLEANENVLGQHPLRADVKGTGLGLRISWDLVKLMGGEIKVLGCFFPVFLS